MLTEDVFSATTQKTLFNQRFATELSAQTLPILNDMAKWLRRTLYDNDSLFTQPITKAKTKRFESMLSNIESHLDDIYKEIDDLYMSEFEVLAIDDANLIADVIDDDLKENLLLARPSDSKLWAAVTQNPLHFPDDANNPFVDFTAMVKSLGEKSRQVANAISGSYYSGMTLQETVSQIIGTKANNYADGMIDKSRRDAERVVRTAVTHISTQARNALYEQNSDLIYGYRIVATIDSRTSNICKSWDGTVIKYTAKFQPMPPFHPNCRSNVISEIYGDKLSESGATRAVNFKAQGGIRGGTVGQVSATQTYFDVLKKQSAAQQDLALGKARGKIFRNAGLSIGEFRQALVDEMGRPLTLAEMAKENKKILEYMRKNKELSSYLGE